MPFPCYPVATGILNFLFDLLNNISLLAANIGGLFLLVKVYFASKCRADELKTYNSFLRICTALPANSRGGEKLKFPGLFVVRYHIRPHNIYRPIDTCLRYL